MRLPEGPRPSRGFLSGDTRKEGMNIRHDGVDLLGHTGGPVIAEIGRGDGERAALFFKMASCLVDDLHEFGFCQLFAVQDFVSDDDALEAVGVEGVDELVHVLDLPVVRGGVVAQPDTEPDFHVLFEV